MGKKYVMVVDERGCMNIDGDNNFSMVGVVFEKNYAVQSKDKKSELLRKINSYKEKILRIKAQNVDLKEIMFGENAYLEYKNFELKKFIDELSSLFQGMKFTIIVSTIKQNYGNLKASYNMAVSNLLRNFFSFIVKRRGECGGVIMIERDDKNRTQMQQNFFSVYSKRSDNLGIENIEDIINSFVICREDDESYSTVLKTADILNTIIYRVSNGLREIDNNLISYINYGYKDKIFNSIKSKIYKDQAMSLYDEKMQKISYSGAEMLIKEVKVLEEELINKNMIIDQKEKEICDLTEEIQILQKQLEHIMFNRRREQAVIDIFSEIEDNIKGNHRNSKVM